MLFSFFSFFRITPGIELGHPRTLYPYDVIRNTIGHVGHPIYVVNEVLFIYHSLLTLHIYVIYKIQWALIYPDLIYPEISYIRCLNLGTKIFHYKSIGNYTELSETEISVSGTAAWEPHADSPYISHLSFQL